MGAKYHLNRREKIEILNYISNNYRKLIAYEILTGQLNAIKT